MDPIKIYWEEFPDNDTQLKEVVNLNTPRHTGRILNSTEVTVPQNSNYKRVPKQSSVKKKPANLDKSSVLQQPREDVPKTEAALKDLSASEKQKIAKLVHELAKFGGEKEAAIKELETVKSQYNVSLKKLRTEKEQAVKKHDMLKEKLLEYEILIDEIKQASKFTHLVDCQKTAMNEEPQIKEKESTDQVEKKILHDFSDLFTEQEKKFRLQQDQLQKQIEQVQKLQGSLVQHHSEPQKSVQNDTLSSEIGVNTKKLDSYISSEQNSRILCETPLRKDTSFIPAQHNASLDQTTTNLYTNTSLVEMRSCSIDPLSTPAKQSAVIPKKPSNPKATPNIDSSQNFPSPAFMLDSAEKSVSNVLLSPVQRKHFQPSSIIELVDGLQPRSTSTSVDQYSIQRRTIPKKPTIPKTSSTLKNVYGPKTSKYRGRKSNVDIDTVEKDILDDIFFI